MDSTTKAAGRAWRATATTLGKRDKRSVDVLAAPIDVAEPAVSFASRPSRAAFYSALLQWLHHGRRDESRHVEAMAQLAVALRSSAGDAEKVSRLREAHFMASNAASRLGQAVYQLVMKVLSKAKGGGAKGGGGKNGGAGRADVAQAVRGPTRGGHGAESKAGPAQQRVVQGLGYFEQGSMAAMSLEQQREAKRRTAKALQAGEKVARELMQGALEERSANRAERRQIRQTVAELERTRRINPGR